MPTPSYLLNKYQRTLGSKTRLLQKRMAIEGDISAKKYEADQKLLTAGIGVAGTVGSGLAEYSTAKKGGYEGGIMGYLGEKAKEHYGLDEKTTTITTGAGGKPETSVIRTGAGVGDVKTDYRMAWKEGTSIRKEAAQDWWKNVKGLIPSTKIGKHWESEGKDFLKQSLGIGKSNIPEVKLQGGGLMPSKGDQRAIIDKQKRLKAFQENLPTVDKPPTTHAEDLAKLGGIANIEPETIGPHNLRTQYSPQYKGQGVAGGGDYESNEGYLARLLGWSHEGDEGGSFGDERWTTGPHNLRTQHSPEYDPGGSGILSWLSLKARDIFGEQSNLPYVRAQAAKAEEEKRIKEKERIASLRKYYSQHYSNPFGKKGQ